MSKARDLANAGTALTTVSATELGYLDGVTSAVQTQIDSKITGSSAISPTIVDAKGDIIAATAADTVARLAVGTNDYVLTADSSTATGIKWAALPASGPQMVTAKVPSGSAGGTYTFNNTFAAGQWQVMQNLAGTTTLASQSLTTANDIKSVNVASSTSSATINVQAVSYWENLNGGVTGTGITNGNTGTLYKFSVANGFMYSANNVLARSSDGTTWVSASLTGNECPVIFHDGVYVTGAYVSSYGKIYSSTDGLNWTERVSTFGPAAGYPPYAAAVAPNAANKFLVGGNGGQLSRSANGTSWTSLGTSLTGNNTVNGIASNGNSLYVVVADGGRIITSTDGASFTSRTSNTTNNLFSVAFGNNLFVACGESGTVRTSSDGTTWNTVNGLSGTLRQVIYATGQTYPWVIVSQSGTVYYSTDGSTWLGPITTDLNINSNIYAGVYFNGKYRIGGGTSAITGLSQYKASASVLGTTSSDYYSTFIGPSAITTLS